MTQSPTNPFDELGKLPPLPRPSKPPTYFTFYSFKGGVGRSMALINCAAILAGRGFRVLAMDLDLEAPGISYFEAEKEEDRQQPGFIDILHDAIELGVDAPFADDDPEKAIRHYIRAAEVPANLRTFDDGELYIMPAGKLDGDYEKRRHRVNIPKLYESGRGRPLVQLLRQRINDSRLFDFVLIDSRTGFSDEAGICIRDLGEHLVMLLGLNHQNAFGTARFLEQLKKANIEPKSIDFVLSPVPTGEDNLFNQRRDEVAALLREALGKEPSLDLEIPYHPRLALIETSHQFGLRHDQLFKAYLRLEERLRMRCGVDRKNRLELCFYTYAHRAEPPPDQPLPRMKALLIDGARSPGWRLAANVERAVADGHPEPEFLAALAAVVADEKPIESLDAFAVWRDTAAYSG